MRHILKLLIPLGGVLGIVLLSTSPALAHESRVVGAFKFTVGWKVEPAYSDVSNAVQIFIRNPADNSPVTDVGDGMKVEVLFGTQKTDAVPLKSVFGSPGEYNASMLPTRPGTYTFHFMGAIHGQQVDQSFTSSPTTFNNVEDAKAIQFPANDPTRGELAQNQSRTDSRVQTSQSQIAALQADLKQTRDAAQTDLILAIAGIAVGALGLIALALVVYLERRRRRQPQESDRGSVEMAASSG